MIERALRIHVIQVVPSFQRRLRVTVNNRILLMNDTRYERETQRGWISKLQYHPWKTEKVADIPFDVCVPFIVYRYLQPIPELLERPHASCLLRRSMAR